MDGKLSHARLISIGEGGRKVDNLNLNPKP